MTRLATRKVRASGAPDGGSVELMQQVGARVRQLRKDAGVSRRVLSERSGVSPRYLAQLEAGEGNISIALLQKVAGALAHPVDGLLRSVAVTEDDPARVARLFRQADAATRAQVMGLLDPGRLRAQKAQRVCLVGLRGAGKSTLGAALARQCDAPFIELTAEIEARTGIPLGEIMALYGQDGYRQIETDALNDILAAHERAVIAVAGGIVSEEATFQTLLARCHTIWVKAMPQEYMNRVRAQGDMRPMAGQPQAMARLRQILAVRERHYARADHQLDTSGKTVVQSQAELAALIAADGLLSAKT